MTTPIELTVDQVVDRLAALDGSLPAADGVRVFNDMYLTVTRLVRDHLPGAYFADPAGMARLDAIFAARFLAAVDAVAAGADPSPCWRPLFELRSHPGIEPIQYALAGMNAHIEYDLPAAVLAYCQAAGHTPTQVEADYHRINDLLAQVEAQVRRQLEPTALRPADPLLHVIGVWSVDRAREAAWASVLSLWELRRIPPAARAVQTALAQSVGMVSRALLTPLG
ncbi:hypothetical protein CFP65_0784 [Kitasatospora sp. MMS16-BH015]|uniref:DUF5995 family protein n=1 Tax=Kitasatospora sp. MMS16-BH015 TaxID=2018025 RepID=UPI000CA2779E|nr:DUF5995 family protein [Kitasatospora sp. MMS16-BH015]AUG75732.1 hypothetical protein CFP65_0784 [Kitasatospora sp. MMS16-BH015]